MKVKFIIEDVIGLGFYDSTNMAFRGFLFATQYDTYEEAEKRVEKLPTGVYQINKIFIK